MGSLEVLLATEHNSLFNAALLEKGIVSVLTDLICKLAPRLDTKTILVSLFTALVAKFKLAPGYHWITQSLRAGLLKAIVTSEKNSPGILPETLPVLLTEALPRAMVYYPVLIQVDRTVAEANLLASSASFQASGLIQPWMTFSLVADDPPSVHQGR
ncbi:hypothetical protein DFH06DRAFT_167650 [Mycena polygramma]|nr:hypothetical protein DFH06DRAFT_167650 [Mycena polygramma]